MPLDNIPSVLEYGILSYERARNLRHRSVAMDEVQERRDQKQVPGGLRLHQYANLYFHARNPMLYKRRDQYHDLCILRVSKDVLALPGVILTTRNASSDYVAYLQPRQAERLDFELIFAHYWTHDDPFEKIRRKSIKCAEVLVPNRIDPEYLLGAYVAERSVAVGLAERGFDLPIKVDGNIFFR